VDVVGFTRWSDATQLGLAIAAVAGHLVTSWSLILFVPVGLLMVCHGVLLLFNVGDVVPKLRRTFWRALFANAFPFPRLNAVADHQQPDRHEQDQAP
jgi:hypothetical protein